MNTNKHFLSHLVHFFLEWEMFQKKSCRENQNTLFVLSNFSFQKSSHLWDTVKKYYRVGQATDDSMRHAHCMLDT